MRDMTRQDAQHCGARYMSFRYDKKTNKPIGPQISKPDEIGSYLYGYQVDWEESYPEHPFSGDPYQVVYELESCPNPSTP